MTSLLDRFRLQAGYCRAAGSPLTADVLDAAADDLVSGGPVADLMRPHEDDPPGSVPALRLAGALHRLVLERRTPELALHYPSVGGSAPVEEVWPAAERTCREHTVELQQLMSQTVQTNEVGRSAVLFGALGMVDATTNMQAVALEHRYGRPILPSFHGAWTLGGILGATLTLATGQLPLEVAAGLAVVPLVVGFGPLLPRDHGIAVDDDLTLRKPLPDLVASCIRADEAELGDVSALELESIADGQGLTRRTDGERLDVLRLESCERGRRQRRQVEPLIGPGSKLERQRTHATISLR